MLARVLDAQLDELAPGDRPLLPCHAVVYAGEAGFGRSRPPGCGDHQVDDHIHGHYVCRDLRVAHHRAEDALADGTNQTSGPVPVVHPAGIRLVQAAEDDRGPHDGHGKVARLVQQHVLGQGFGERVRVGSLADQRWSHLVEHVLGQPLYHRDDVVWTVGWRVDHFAHLGAITVRVGRGYVDEGLCGSRGS